jgi:hypothetical protein
MSKKAGKASKKANWEDDWLGTLEARFNCDGKKLLVPRVEALFEKLKDEGEVCLEWIVLRINLDPSFYLIDEDDGEVNEKGVAAELFTDLKCTPTNTDDDAPRKLKSREKVMAVGTAAVGTAVRLFSVSRVCGGSSSKRDRDERNISTGDLKKESGKDRLAKGAKSSGKCAST